MWIILTLIAMVFYGVAEYLAKRYATDGSLSMFLYGLAFYVACTILWFPALRNNNNLAVMTVTWSVLYVIIGIAVSALFKEHISVVQQIGCGLAIIVILLLHWH